MLKILRWAAVFLLSITPTFAAIRPEAIDPDEPSCYCELHGECKCRHENLMTLDDYHPEAIGGRIYWKPNGKWLPIIQQDDKTKWYLYGTTTPRFYAPESKQYTYYNGGIINLHLDFN